MNLFVGIIQDGIATLNQEESHHCVKVLRKNIGDEILVTNGKGEAISGPITKISKKEVEVGVKEEISLPSKTTGLHLAVALTKNIDRYEFLIEKATEFGADAITPITCFHSERTKINPEKLRKKAIAANKQALRSNFLVINPIQSLESFVQSNEENPIFIAHCNLEGPRKNINEVNFPGKPIVLIGPEGDFSKQEILEISSLPNAEAISLGPNRLRTETAGIYAASYFYSLISRQ